MGVFGRETEARGLCPTPKYVSRLHEAPALLIALPSRAFHFARHFVRGGLGFRGSGRERGPRVKALRVPAHRTVPTVPQFLSVVFRYP